VWSGLFDFLEGNRKFCQRVKAATAEGNQPSPISAKTYTFLEPKKSKNGTLAFDLYKNRAECCTDSDDDGTDSDDNERGNKDASGNHNDDGGE
jgi:hypothetical protein